MKTKIQSIILMFALFLAVLPADVNAAGIYGPQAAITCPAGSVNINPGTNNIQAVITANPGNTTFCLKAGVFNITTPITPKTGNTIVGQYGAILDGTNWPRPESDQSAAAIRAWNQDIDNVTIRNLVVRNFPIMGIAAYYWMSDNWTIENNEVSNNLLGVNAPNSSIVRNNYIHHNLGNPNDPNPSKRGGGYAAQEAFNVTFEANEISYNGPEQKVLGNLTNNITFRNNFVHHNVNGIWLDGLSWASHNGTALIEGNTVEDNSETGIFYEVSPNGIIRNNTIRRNGTNGNGNGIFISTSWNTEIYNNLLEDNATPISYFVACDVIQPGVVDLHDNNAHHNTIVVSTQANGTANMLGSSVCSSTQLTPYINGSKNLKFQSNTYYLPTAAEIGWSWIWGAGRLSWTQWKAIPQDSLSATPQVGRPPTPVVGDINLDHIVNAIDYSILNSKWFTTDSASDLNRDGFVNAIDYSILNSHWFMTW